MAALFRRILHPTDFSAASTAAFRKALQLARGTSAELLLVHVITPIMPAVGEGYIPPTTYAELEASVREHATKEIDKRLAKARQAGIRRVKAFVLQGVIHDQIVRAARGRRADLIVMGTHGRGGLARLVLGSVAQRVVGSATVPVLTVRG